MFVNNVQHLQHLVSCCRSTCLWFSMSYQLHRSAAIFEELTFIQHANKVLDVLFYCQNVEGQLCCLLPNLHLCTLPLDQVGKDKNHNSWSCTMTPSPIIYVNLLITNSGETAIKYFTAKKSTVMIKKCGVLLPNFHQLAQPLW